MFQSTCTFAMACLQLKLSVAHNNFFVLLFQAELQQKFKRLVDERDAHYRAAQVAALAKATVAKPAAVAVANGGQ